MKPQKQRSFGLAQFIKRFSNVNECINYYKEIRWPDGHVVCPHCGNDQKVYVTNRGYKCGKVGCMKKFSLTVGTLFDNKNIPLNTWFLLIYLSSDNRKSISSVQMAKNLGVTQKSAWYALHDMRSIFHEDRDIRLDGTVEIDECFLGGGTRWSRYGNISTRKQPVLGMIERKGLAVIKLIEDRGEGTIEKTVLKHVSQTATVYTDGWLGYNGLQKYYLHDFVNHSDREYVRGDVHTNSIENLWGVLKKSIKYGHGHISSFHVQGYCNEVAYKHNTRSMTTLERFNDMLKRTDFTKEKSIYNVQGLATNGMVIPMNMAI